MYHGTFFFMHVAIFLLMWTHITVMGIPKTRFQQCKDRGFDTACEFECDNFPCQILSCGRHYFSVFFERFQLLPYHGVPDNTKCGESKICKNKKCVNADGPMPLYFGNTTLSHCVRGHQSKFKPMPTRHEQCKNYGFDVACEPRYGKEAKGRRGAKGAKRQRGVKEYSCSYLQCGDEITPGSYIRRTRFELAIRPVPSTGTRCGDNKICFKSQCVPLSKSPWSSKIPLYTGNEIFKKCKVHKQ